MRRHAFPNGQGGRVGFWPAERMIPNPTYDSVINRAFRRFGGWREMSFLRGAQTD